MPGRMARTGLGHDCRMTWICPGDVWVRRSTPGVVVWKVSHMSRAGWCGGMFSSSKLVRSSSTSLLRNTWKPRSAKMAGWPGALGRLGGAGGQVGEGAVLQGGQVGGGGGGGHGGTSVIEDPWNGAGSRRRVHGRFW